MARTDSHKKNPLHFPLRTKRSSFTAATLRAWGGPRTTVEWSGLRRIFANDPQDPQRNWWLGAIRFVFDTRLAFSMYTASRECLYGLFVANIVKAMWAADTESSSYAIYAPYVSWVLYESLHFLGGTKWPMFALLHHFTSLKRHGFQLDFTAQDCIPASPLSPPHTDQPLILGDYSSRCAAKAGRQRVARNKKM